MTEKQGILEYIQNQVRLFHLKRELRRLKNLQREWKRNPLPELKPIGEKKEDV